MTNHRIESLSERFAYNPGAPPRSAVIESKHTPNKVVKHRVRPFKYHISELTYAHLSPLPDLLKDNLKLLFCGFNPGIQSATVGHRFAHRSNCFWSLIHDSGIVPDKLSYEDDVAMPERYNIGFTELVMRPTKGVEEIPQQEMRSNVPRLVALVNEQRPKVLCLVGRGIWDAISKYLRIQQKKFEWGEQKQSVFKCIVFVVPSTSGLVRMKHEEKLVIWRQLKELVDREMNV